MRKKSTDDLMKLLKSGQDIRAYMNANQTEFIEDSLADKLNDYANLKHISKAELALRSGIEKSYVTKIMNRQKQNPSRDCILSLCIGLGLSLDETQTLLKETNTPQLYPRIPRDSIVIAAITQRKSAMEVNELLYGGGFSPLVH